MFTPAPSQTSELMSEEDKLSDFLSASQVGTIMSRTGFIKDPDYVPSNKTDSQISDYFSDENSSDSLVFSCNFHSLSFDNVDEFEEHQLSYHTVNGRVECGICEKTYSTKYLQRNHIQGYHLGVKYVCGIENCGKSYPLKRYRDEHEHNFHKPTSNIRYVCDICSEIFESMELLQQHKIKHSSTKKYVCRYCKVRGYTRTNDRDGHEAECPQRFTSVRPKEAKSSSSSKKKGPKKKLFAAKPNQAATQSTSTGKRVDPVDMFPSEPDESESDVPSQRQQPMRNCKNGVSEGFYKNGCSPNVKKECNSSSDSGTSSVKSPKPSIKGQHRCSICKQSFADRNKLIYHAELQHRNRDRRSGLKCFRCTILFDNKTEYDVHMSQHAKDDKNEIKHFKPYKAPPVQSKKKKEVN